MNKPVSIQGVRLSCSQDRSYFRRVQQILEVSCPAGAGKCARADSFVTSQHSRTADMEKENAIGNFLTVLE